MHSAFAENQCVFILRSLQHLMCPVLKGKKNFKTIHSRCAS